MEINLMTWNTQLYEYDNSGFGKSIKEGLECCKDIYEIVKTHLNKENSVAVLQEIPYKSNVTWKKHELFEAFENTFQEKDYDLLYNISAKKQIKMTVIVAKKGIIVENNNGLNNNKFVSFFINNTDLSVLGVHSGDALELKNELLTKELFRPNIILGDFNSGNYVKDKHDKLFELNRQNYQSLSEGYLDISQGEITFKHGTYIDHILVEYSKRFLENNKYSDVIVDCTIELSDHYPIYCKINCN